MTRGLVARAAALLIGLVAAGCGSSGGSAGPSATPSASPEKKYGVKGDFSQAYVVAHELGHHIQNLTGVSSQVSQLSQQYPAQANQLSIRAEIGYDKGEPAACDTFAAKNP